MTENLVTLRAAFGQDEATHGLRRYRVDNDGTVQVPPDAVAPLIHTGGFYMADTETAEAPPGSALVRNSDPTATTGLGKPDGNGNFLVPAAVLRGLAAHGFLPVADGTGAAREPKTRSKG